MLDVQVPASLACVDFLFEGRRWDVLALEGAEALGQAFHFRITLLTSRLFDVHAHRSPLATLRLHNPTGADRTLSGLVTKLESDGFHDDKRKRVILSFEPRLALLKRQREARIFFE